MAEVPSEEVVTGSSTEGDISDQQQQFPSSESLAEWRSSEQLENGTPSTSPPYWDSDDDDDGGPKPAELYGKYTWKINKFSQINKRELRSNPFEIGGYKWYILIYPQGCDVCNHLSLFLCVANHDKLLPGWSHFAQFTIAVVNKDPKKSKYSDTLHRFWKKEHDWGWKKFMELSKVFDGFIDSDTLIIKAQVQVIRERADRPFRCLDCHYRRELIRVYLTNVEQVCRRFVEDRQNKLGKLLEDKVRWSSFCAFWRSIDPRSRCQMSQEKTETILKVVVKQFFIEKEVTSTLVMDSLYSGLKALEGPSKDTKNKSKYLESEESFTPIIRVEKNMFMLDDDVLQLLERAATELLPPKDETGPQNRSKDGAVGGEFNKDCVERDERRLTKLGRWTIEIFILAHMFSKIEVAYQEAIALKKQEELIREEEAAWLAGTEHRSRRGRADKEKKSKKKQGKQKRNSHKGKDKARDEKTSHIVQVEMEQDSFGAKSDDIANSNEAMELEKYVAPADVSDVSDSVDCAPERNPPDSEDRDVSPRNWDTDVSEAHRPIESCTSGVTRPSSMQNGTEGNGTIVDDNSSSSSESSPSMPQKSKSRHNKSKKPSRRRGRSHLVEHIADSPDLIVEENNHPSEVGRNAGQAKHVGETSKSDDISPTAFSHPFQDMAVNGSEHPAVKEEEASFVPRNVSIKDANAEASLITSACLARTSKEVPSASQKLVKVDVSSNPVFRKKSSSYSLKKSNISKSSAKSFENIIQKGNTPTVDEKTPKDAVHSRSEMVLKDSVSVTVDKLVVPPVPTVSRSCSVPIVPSSKVNVSSLPLVPTSSTLARSASAAGRLGPESTSTATQSYVPLSYRNAMMGGPVTGTSGSYSLSQSSSLAVNSSVPYPQAPPQVSTSLFAQYGSESMDMNQLKTALPIGMLNRDPLQHGRSLRIDSCHRDGIRNAPGEVATQLKPQDNGPSATAPRMPHRSTHVSPEEFPHLDIINDLLDDENVDTSIAESAYQSFRNAHNRPHFASNTYGFPDDAALPSSTRPLTGLCRLERAPSPGDERFLYTYSMGPSSEALQDMNPHSGLHSYGLIPNQWQVAGHPERPFLNGRSLDDSYAYRLLDFQNMSIGSTGFPLYRPSNGL